MAQEGNIVAVGVRAFFTEGVGLASAVGTTGGMDPVEWKVRTENVPLQRDVFLSQRVLQNVKHWGQPTAPTIRNPRPSRGQGRSQRSG